MNHHRVKGEARTGAGRTTYLTLVSSGTLDSNTLGSTLDLALGRRYNKVPTVVRLVKGGLRSNIIVHVTYCSILRH